MITRAPSLRGRRALLASAFWVPLAGLVACSTPPAPRPDASAAAPTATASSAADAAPKAAPSPESAPMPNAAGSEEANPPPPQIAAPAPLPAAKAATCSCAVPIAHHAKRRKPKEKMPQGPEPPPPEARPEPNAVVDAEVGQVNTSLTSILGKDVKSPKGEDLGRIVDVLADPDGRVRVAIIDFGGFLGVGNRRIAVDWPLLHFNPDAKDKSLVLSVTREKLQSTPEYKDPLSPRVLMPPAVPSHDPDPGQATK